VIGPALVLAGVSLLSIGCSRLDMQDQPKYKSQRPSDFFVDGRSDRPELEGTIARGQLDEDVAFYEGEDAAGKDIAEFPIAVDKAVIQRGQQRYDIYCAPCHGRLGNGMGMIVQRGFKQPPSYHIDRLRNAPVGHYFDVITNGYGAMLNYAQQIQVRDRWAIIAYIRALQYSQNANVNDLPVEARAQIPAAGQPMSAEMKTAMQAEPMASPDKDFMNFPALPATPAGVPGAMGAGAAEGYNPGSSEKSQPERK
jgi:mono/diheme cytochrome c family protein